MFRNKIYDKYLYGNMHGEDIIKIDDKEWHKKFLHEFAKVQVPYHFLCSKKRLKIKGFLLTKTCIFSDNVESKFKNRMITQNSTVLKYKNPLFLPYVHNENTYFAYSEKGDNRFWPVNKNAKSANVTEITPSGAVFKEQLKVKDGKLGLKIEPQDVYKRQVYARYLGIRLPFKVSVKKISVHISKLFPVNNL